MFLVNFSTLKMNLKNFPIKSFNQSRWWKVSEISAEIRIKTQNRLKTFSAAFNAAYIQPFDIQIQIHSY